jgi:hypothetical protein
MKGVMKDVLESDRSLTLEERLRIDDILEGKEPSKKKKKK